jgi:Fe-S cluster assembly protein SufD
MNHPVSTHIPVWLKQSFAGQSPAAEWLREFKEKHRAAFLRRGLPNTKEESWKYTDVSYLQQQEFFAAENLVTEIETLVAARRLPQSILLVLINGVFAPEFSDLSLLPTNIILCDLPEAVRTQTTLLLPLLNSDTERFPFASLNAALLMDGVFLSVPKKQAIKHPIHLLYLNASNTNFVNSPRNIIFADQHSEVTLLEEHCGVGVTPYFTNVVTSIYAAENAKVHYHKIQNENLAATHIAQIIVEQNADSEVNTHALAIGAKLAREDIMVKQTARGAACSVNGLYWLSQDEQHIDNHIHIDHIAEHGASDLVYKGVLDKKSRAVFNGKILVHQDAQKIQSHQKNHNLLLSPKAEIDTKPELEIYADDVKCAHGATVGQLDEAALFYLRARGIDTVSALKMLTNAFAADVFNKIANTAIKEKMQSLLNEIKS